MSFSGETTAVSAITETLQGKASYSVVSQTTGASLYSEGNDSITATAIDGDSEGPPPHKFVPSHTMMRDDIDHVAR